MSRALQGTGALLLIAGSALTFASPASAASESASLDQCQDGTVRPIPNNQCTSADPADWINGDLNANKAVYREGDTVPFRAILTNLTGGAGSSHSATIQYQTTKGGHHAYDYLTTLNNTVPAPDPCAGLPNGVTCPSGTPDTSGNFPADPNVTPTSVPNPYGHMTCYGCTVTGFGSYSIASGSYAADSLT
ncbi:MAG: hypothetical protein ACREOE_19275, partial [Gemmatimonadales bacterium]